MTVEKEIPYEKWVKALRSGDYNQTRCTLKGELAEGGVGYCCLGVLAEIMGYELETQRLVPVSDSDHTTYNDEGPEEIYEHFYNKIGTSGMDFVVTYNDEGKDFNYIADYIEKGLMTDEGV